MRERRIFSRDVRWAHGDGGVYFFSTVNPFCGVPYRCDSVDGLQICVRSWHWCVSCCQFSWEETGVQFWSRVGGERGTTENRKRGTSCWQQRDRNTKLGRVSTGIALGQFCARWCNSGVVSRNSTIRVSQLGYAPNSFYVFHLLEIFRMLFLCRTTSLPCASGINLPSDCAIPSKQTQLV